MVHETKQMNDGFSVIIPTLWYVEFQSQIELLNSNDLVNEIIVINNDKSKTPSWFANGSYNKVLEIIPHTNLFVNPSWNLGIRASNSKFILLQNDDIVCKNYHHLDNIKEKLETEDCLIGNADSVYTHTEGNLFLEEIEIWRIESGAYAKAIPWGWGCSLFLRKESYKEIPDQIKVWYGDKLLCDRFEQKGKSVYCLHNVDFSLSRMSQTCEDEKFSFKDDEVNLYESHTDEYISE